MCAVEAQRCVDCVSAVLHAVLTRAATLRALFDANRRTWRSWKAVGTRELHSADDQAAMLGWRLDDTGNQDGFQPLPWLPAIPQRLHEHQTWGPYLAARAAMVAELANRVRRSVGADRLPIWVGDGLGQPPARLVEDIEVWRAAMGVSPDDQRPTGPLQQHKTARVWQRQLDEALGGSLSPRGRSGHH